VTLDKEFAVAVGYALFDDGEVRRSGEVRNRQGINCVPRR